MRLPLPTAAARPRPKPIWTGWRTNDPFYHPRSPLIHSPPPLYSLLLPRSLARSPFSMGKLSPITQISSDVACICQSSKSTKTHIFANSLRVVTYTTRGKLRTIRNNNCETRTIGQNTRGGRRVNNGRPCLLLSLSVSVPLEPSAIRSLFIKIGMTDKILLPRTVRHSSYPSLPSPPRCFAPPDQSKSGFWQRRQCQGGILSRLISRAA